MELLDLLIQNIAENKRHSEDQIKEVKASLDKIDSKLDSLMTFKWKIIGGIIATNAIVGFMLKIYIEGRIHV